MPKGTKGKTPASKVETGGTPAGPAGDGDETIYFWRETDEYGYMSQWAGTPFRDRDDPSKIYKTAEQYVSCPLSGHPSPFRITTGRP